MLIDRNARRRNAQTDFQLDTFYGQIEHLYLIEVPAVAYADFGITNTLEATIIFAAVRTCELVDDEIDGDLLKDLDFHFYSKHGALHVIDVTSIQCLVGRVKDGKGWAIIDRSGSLARALYLDDDED